MSLLLSQPAVPILGQRFRILDHTSQAVIACLCPGGGVVLLPGPGVVRTCAACGTPYAIGQAAQLTVGIVVPSAVEGVKS